MELRTLRYFLVVAREENITKAASLIHISQPSLSRQLMQMEEQLGVKLFHRSKHSVILTDEGRLLRRRAQEIVALADKAEKELAQGEEAISGEITIGCGETKNMAYLSQMMVSFREQYPDVTFDIYTAIADDVKERIENGILDFGLMLEPVEITKYNFVRMPLKESWALSRKSGIAYFKLFFCTCCAVFFLILALLFVLCALFFALFHGNAFSGDGGLIHRAPAFYDDTVYRDALSRLYYDYIAYDDLFAGYGDLFSVPQDQCGFGSKVHQFSEGIGSFGF